VLPCAGHRVGGIVLSFHHQARAPIGPTKIGDIRVPLAVWSPVPSSRQRAEISMDDLVRQLGW
jgi:hypothetical protein